MSRSASRASVAIFEATSGKSPGNHNRSTSSLATAAIQFTAAAVSNSDSAVVDANAALSPANETFISGASKLAETLRHPEDLERISMLKSQYTSDKAAIDAQLKAGVQSQLEVTKAGMTALEDGQKIITLIKEEMIKIDKLCSESQDLIQEFPLINQVSRVHRNFVAVQEAMDTLAQLETDVRELEAMLQADDAGKGVNSQMPNLVPIHHKLTQLRDFRDEVMYQSTKTQDDTRSTLENYFAIMDEVVYAFEDRFGILLMNVLDIVRAGNFSLVVRLAKIIEAEERSDDKVRALQEAKSQHSELVARFKSIQIGSQAARGYKQKFIECIESVVNGKFDEAEKDFEEDSSSLHDSFDWYFDDLDVVKHNLSKLVPPKWKIFETYLDIYHGRMHEFITKLVAKEDLDGQGLLQIILWKSRYDAGLKSLGVNKSTLKPPMLGGNEEDLVKEYLNIIVTKMAEWMKNVIKDDTKEFVSRTQSPEEDESGRFYLQGAVITFQMINQQIDVASDANKASVIVGVVDECCRLLKERQTHWENMTRQELDRFIEAPDETQGGILEWMVAVANDQARCAVYTESVKSRLEPALPNKVKIQVNSLLEGAIIGFLDTASVIISRIIELIFNDLKPATSVIFTPAWYGSKHMEQITLTFGSYLSDCKQWLDESILPELFYEICDETVATYLSCVKNKGAKLLVKSGNVFGQVREDVATGFKFFSEIMGRDQVKQSWVVVELFLQLATAPKEDLLTTYKDFKIQYWDLPNLWAEQVLKIREDSSRDMVGIVKTGQKDLGQIEIGSPTIMAKVKIR